MNRLQVSGVSLALALFGRRLWTDRATVSVDQAQCSFAFVPNIAIMDDQLRFGFVSLSTEIERIPRDRFPPLDLAASRPLELSEEETLDRFLNGHVGVLVTGPGSPPPDVWSLPADYKSQRDRLRQLQSHVRCLMLQIALEEMTDFRGASADLLDELEGVWNVPLAITMDLAVIFTLGANRQRYTVDSYSDRIRLRRQGILAHLARRGVESNRLLTI